MYGSMLMSGSSLTPRVRIQVLCLIVSASTVSVTLFEKSELPLNISHSIVILNSYNLKEIIVFQMV